MKRLIAFLAVVLFACGRKDEPPAPPPPLAAAKPAAEGLAALSAELKPELLEVAPGIYDAIGYGLANTIFIEGPEGVVVVDAQATLESARAVLAEYRKGSDKPIRALIYTHSHPDHVYGAAAFTADAGGPLPVYAHEDVGRTIDLLATEFQPILTQRATRMYGTALPAQERLGLGVGLNMEIGPHSTFSIVRPNRTFADRLEDTVAGVHFELVHAPGETDDHLFVWLPERRIALPGDNIYKAFPNLYTLRGTTPRDVKQWAASLDRIRALDPEIVIPSHTRPIVGRDAVQATLTDYRDAIRFVYDQTVRRINLGHSPDRIAAELRLPPHLASSPWLQELYGTVRWSARGVYAGNLGWYDANATHLDPLPPDEEARRFVELAGGPAALGQRIAAARSRGEHQWVLEMTDRALRADPADAAARTARVEALAALGNAASNPNARHWYLTAAHELKDNLVLPRRLATPSPEMLREMPLAAYFEALAVNLHAEDALEMDRKAVFHFTDTGERWTLWVRRGVCEVRPAPLDGAEFEIEVETQAFKEMLARVRNPVKSLAVDFEVVKGSKLAFARFMQLFAAPEA